jgi:hypothetical protein
MAVAVAAVAVAQEMGVCVPRELSIVAWDDSPLCRLVHPQLSAVSRDIAGYGARAAERLLTIVNGTPASTVEDATPRLVARGSTAPATGELRLELLTIDERRRTLPVRRSLTCFSFTILNDERSEAAGSRGAAWCAVR